MIGDKLKININIDELVLEGIDHRDYPQIISAAKLELTRLVMEEGLFQNMSNYDKIVSSTKSKPMNVIYANSKNLDAVGIHIARSICESLK